MIEFVPFRAEHLACLQLQAAQTYLTPLLKDHEYAAALELKDLTWTGKINGFVVGCAGIRPQWEGRAITWALLGQIQKSAWLSVTRKVVETMDLAHQLGTKRIEANVKADFPPGRRWVELMGFELETPNGMRCFGADSSTHLLYSRVRP